MAHIILKTIKTTPTQAKLTPEQAAPMPAQPMVIDFSKQRLWQPSPNILYALLGAIISFFITSVVALFMLGDQLNHMWREAQHISAQSIQASAVQNIKNNDEPEAAFPATAIPPLPSKAFILGKDFQKSKGPEKLDLVPMLERLPVAQSPKPSLTTKSYIEVETSRSQTKSERLQQQADEAIATGHINKAIELYMSAIKSAPNDVQLRSNCVALLLEQARAFDEQGEYQPAISAYKKAQSLWRGDAQTAKAIKARIQFLENN